MSQSNCPGPPQRPGRTPGSVGTGQGQLRHQGQSHGMRTWPNGCVPTMAPEGKTADSGAHERPLGHQSEPMATTRTHGTHGVGRQRSGPFGSGMAPPRADHRPLRRLRWPISPSRPQYTPSTRPPMRRLAAIGSWAFCSRLTIDQGLIYGGPCTRRVLRPAGRDGPSEAPQRPMVADPAEGTPRTS